MGWSSSIITLDFTKINIITFCTTKSVQRKTKTSLVNRVNLHAEDKRQKNGPIQKLYIFVKT